ASGASRQALSGDCTLMSRSPTSSFSFAQLAALGHEGSPGRTRRAGSFSGMAARRVLGNTGRKARAAARLSRLLLFSKKAKVSLTALRNAFSRLDYKRDA